MLKDQDLPRLRNLLDAMPRLQKDIMIHALKYQNLEMVDLVLDSGLSIETSITPHDHTALLCATQQKDIDITRRLLEKGANVNCKDKEGYRCLHVAVEDGDLEMTTLLIDNGASVNVFTNDGLSPLINNLQSSPSLAIVKLLVESGANINQARSPVFTPLHAAAYNGYTDIVVYLLQNGADIECRSFNKMTPILYACKEGQMKTAEVLIENGANLRIKRPDGKSILAHVCLHGHESIVRLLVRNGIEIDEEALNIARQVGNEDILNYLLDDHETDTSSNRSNTNVSLIGAMLIAGSAWYFSK